MPSPSRSETRLIAIRKVLDAQINDKGLWFDAETAPEAHLQQALRELHAVIEGVSGDEIAMAILEQKT